MDPRATSGPAFLAAFLLSAGCGDGGGGGNPAPSGPVALEDLPVEAAEVFCGVFEDCAGPLAELFFGGSDCVDTLASGYADSDLTRLQTAIDQGTVVYDPEQARACLNALAALGCNLIQNRQPDVCEQAIQGTVALGEGCDLDEECEGAAYCAIDAACPGVCAELLAAGDLCEDDGQCVSGLTCQAGACTAPAQDGERCDGTRDPSCALGLACLGAEGDEPGTCVSLEQMLVGADGASCNVRTGPLCRDGLSCTVDTVLPLAMTCRPPAASGAACRLSFPDECPDGEYCAGVDAGTGDVEGTCTPLPDYGEPCTTGALAPRCAPGLACAAADECVRVQRIGGACTSDAGCYSGYCDGTVCAAPALCESD